MENNELIELISVFKEYRDLITPIEKNLQNFATSFDSIKANLNDLNNALGKDVKQEVVSISNNIAEQTEKTKRIMNDISKFASQTDRYISSVDQLISICGTLESRIKTVDSIQQRADEQIAKLDNLIEEKKKVYDLKQLQKNLELYNIGVEKVSEYINKDIAENLKNNSDKIGEIKNKNESVYQTLIEEKSTLHELISAYTESNNLLKKITENKDVNEAYIFDILDKWAEDRKIRIKK